MRERTSTGIEEWYIIQLFSYSQRSRDVHFRMEATSTFRKALDRQVDESVRIKYFSRTDGVILNSGSEWRADSLPRASFTAPGLERRKEIRRNL